MAKNRKNRGRFAPGEFSVVIEGRMPEENPLQDLMKIMLMGLGEQLADANAFARSMARDAARPKSESGCHCKPAPFVPTAPKPESKSEIGCSGCQAPLLDIYRHCPQCGKPVERRKKGETFTKPGPKAGGPAKPRHHRAKKLRCSQCGLTGGAHTETCGHEFTRGPKPPSS
jgi:hypothetical protein